MSKYRSETPFLSHARTDLTCPETGKPIKKGEAIVYCPKTKLSYHKESQIAKSLKVTSS